MKKETVRKWLRRVLICPWFIPVLLTIYPLLWIMNIDWIDLKEECKDLWNGERTI
ncbi:MAG: hypothetical protein GY845_25720 [Planctomycetes bacterium]|nr:hypothetical protein [Planctomycetota bacterium]